MPGKTADYLNIIHQFATKRILVIGDFIIDAYVQGISTRLSPEAPVPVVDVLKKNYSPGGAANAAHNLHALGATVHFLSVIGDDETGIKAIQVLETHGIETAHLVCVRDRRTIIKTRVMADARVLIRFDEGTETPLDVPHEQKIIERLYNLAAESDAILISDYGKGVLTKNIVYAIHDIAAARALPVVVDSKRLAFFAELSPFIVKPNYEEVIALCNLPRQTTARVTQVKNALEMLEKKTNANIIAVTLDSEGAVIFRNGHVACEAQAPPVSSPCVSGAGDTFISAFMLTCLVCGDLETAATVAVAAANIVIAHEATEPCWQDALVYHFGFREKYITTFDDLRQLTLHYRHQRKKIVFTNGCFDILHSGHVRYLRQAKELGDVLIVGVNRDDSIRRIKGSGRPINPLSDRVAVLAGLSSVDHIIDFGNDEDDTPIPLIEIIQPDIFVKGGDYTTEKLPEAPTIQRHGGEIIFLPYLDDHSTSHMIKRIHDQSTTVNLVVNA